MYGPFGKLLGYLGRPGSILPVDPPRVPAKPPTGQAESPNGTPYLYDDGVATGWGSCIPGYKARPASTISNYLDCLRHPVVAMARAYVRNPIESGGVKLVKQRDDAKDEWGKYVETTTKHLLRKYVADALWAMDLGWAPFELRWERPDGRYVIEEILPGRPEIDSGVYVDQHTGRAVGVRSEGIDLYGFKGLRYTYDQRGRNYLGRSRLENVLKVEQDWGEANDKTAKLANKASGVLFVVEYPPDSPGMELGTRRKQAEAFAKQAIGGSGYIAVPRLGGITEDVLNRAIASDPAKLVTITKLSLWGMNVLDLGDQGSAIVALTEEKKHLEALMCHGYFVPPETILQGVGGNQAKTASAGASGTAVNEFVSRGIYEALNQQAIDALLELEFGKAARGSFAWVPDSLEDDQPVFDRVVIQAAMSAANPDVQAAVAAWDFGAIAERNGVPKLSKADLRKRDEAKAAALAQQPAAAPGDPNAEPGSALALSAYDPSKHPRGPAGSGHGGEFVADDDPATAEREEAESRADEDREATEQFRDGTAAEYAEKIKAVVDDGIERIRAVRLEVDTEVGVVDPADYQPGGSRHRANGEASNAEVMETFAADRDAAEDSLQSSLDDARTEVDDAVSDVREEIRGHADDFRGEAADYDSAAHDKAAARAVVADARKAFAEQSAAELGRAKAAGKSAKAGLARQHQDQIDGLRSATLTLPPDPQAD